MKVYVLIFDKTFDTGLSTVLDTFSLANDLAGAAGTSSTHFEVTVVSTRRHVRTDQGLSVPVALAKQLVRPDIVLIPALGAKMPDPLKDALKRREVTDAGNLLRQWSGEGTLTTAACTGTFVLAGTSLLDGHNATTSWWLAPLFRKLYPSVKLEESRMVVDSSHFVTAGAALAHVDLALWLVRQNSPELAALVARYLLVDPRSSQGVFMVSNHLVHTDPIISRFEKWARQSLGDGFSLSKAAKVTGTTERTLARHLKSVLDKTPLSYFQDIRVEHAVHLLRTGNDSVDQIASKVGYADGITLRNLLRRKLGRSVSELRVPN